MNDQCLVGTQDSFFFQSILNGNRQEILWVGKFPTLPFVKSTCAPFDSENYFRATPDLHGNFKYVFAVEYNLGEFKQWPLILDELFNLGQQHFHLFLRFSQSQFLTIFTLKKLLFNKNKNIEVVFERITDDGMYELCCYIEKKERVNSLEKGWTFGVLYDGKNESNLKAFIESVYLSSFEVNFEIIVVGPKVEFLEDFPLVRFISHSLKHDKLGWITRKKNLIVENANYENICIVHNRYIIPYDFLESFERFGYSFDVVVVRQITEDQVTFPYWVTLGSSIKWTQSAQMDPRDYSPYIYVNGGLIIAKKSVLSEVRWNDLLFWNQAEDVELTQRLFEKGYVPRLNYHCVFKVIESRSGYLESFTHIPYSRDEYILPLDDRLYQTHFVLRDGSLFTVYDISLKEFVGKKMKKYLFTHLSRGYKNSFKLVVESRWISKYFPQIPKFILKLRDIIKRNVL